MAEFRNGIVHAASAMAARTGLLETRTQCSVAISADGHRWVLVNASPDLRSQLIDFRPNRPPQRRGTPIEAILLTDADLDHTLGLFLLRENESPLSIHASMAIKEAVEEGLRLTEILSRYCGVQWVTAPSHFETFLCREGKEIGLEYRAFEIEGPGPRYRRAIIARAVFSTSLRESATGKIRLAGSGGRGLRATTSGRVRSGRCYSVRRHVLVE